MLVSSAAVGGKKQEIYSWRVDSRRNYEIQLWFVDRNASS